MIQVKHARKRWRWRSSLSMKYRPIFRVVPIFFLPIWHAKPRWLKQGKCGRFFFIHASKQYHVTWIKGRISDDESKWMTKEKEKAMNKIYCKSFCVQAAAAAAAAVDDCCCGELRCRWTQMRQHKHWNIRKLTAFIPWQNTKS